MDSNHKWSRFNEISELLISKAPRQPQYTRNAGGRTARVQRGWPWIQPKFLAVSRELSALKAWGSCSQRPLPSHWQKRFGACPGFVVDHVIAWKHDGLDEPANMQSGRRSRR